MPRAPSFKIQRTDKGWKVEIPASLSATGKRERSYHSTRDAAKEHASKLRTDRDSFGANAQSIRPALAEEAAKAAAILEPFGISLLEAARRIAAMETATKASSSLPLALKNFLKVKEGKSESQINAYDYMAKDLLTAFGDRSLAGITGQELLDHVETRTNGAATFNHRIRLVKAFWRWCAKHPRSWCEAKVVDMLEAKETTKRPVGVLSFKQAQDLLNAAETQYPECVPGFAIALFTGMRQAELERLEPSDITKEGITVPAISSKTGQRRFIEMPLPLAHWLKAYPIGETVLPANWVRKDKAVRRLAGWRVWSDLLSEASPAEELPAWPENALRHTHASVAVARGVPLDQLTFTFGHSGGATTIRRHYLGTMTKAEASKIWSIGPKGSLIKVSTK